MHVWQTRAPHVLLEENLDEIAYAVWASRAASEHVTQPDPYLLNSHQTLPMSFATAQPLPAWVIGHLARIIHQPVTTLFFLGSFGWPCATGFLFIIVAWGIGVRERWTLTLGVIFSLVALPPTLWLMQWHYVTAILTGLSPGFRLSLALSRRYQPQFTAVIHYMVVALSLVALRLGIAWQRWLLSLFAGIAFGLSFYCYYFSWTLLLGWFVLGGACVWLWQRERLSAWLSALCVGLLIAVPYFRLILGNFSAISSSAASTRTYNFPQDPAIYTTLLVCAFLACALPFERERKVLLWAPLVLNLVAVFGAMQNVVTGIYIQPYHYLHYFARPTTNLALIALCVFVSERWGRTLRGQQWMKYLSIMVVILSLLTAIFFQGAHYRDVAGLASETVAAQPAMQALREHAEPGTLVYCPEETPREAIPLYTDNVSFFSRYMLLNETSGFHVAMQQRIAEMQWLSGISTEAFAAWLKTRPVDVYLQHLQRRIDALNEAQMEEVAGHLQVEFAKLEQAPLSGDLLALRYALLPVKIKLETTRLPQSFNCQQLWADEYYTLFRLTQR